MLFSWLCSFFCFAKKAECVFSAVRIQPEDRSLISGRSKFLDQPPLHQPLQSSLRLLNVAADFFLKQSPARDAFESVRSLSILQEIANYLFYDCRIGFDLSERQRSPGSFSCKLRSNLLSRGMLQFLLGISLTVARERT